MDNANLTYICTDSDCTQYVAKISDARFSFIEYREPSNSYVVSHAIVDLQDYSLDEIFAYCSGYYNSLEEIVSIYGFRGALQIMAECIFEQFGFDDMEFNVEQETEETAIEFIHKWIMSRSDCADVNS